MAGVQDQLEIRFRLTDGSDIGPKSFPTATNVATLKESVLAHWPKEKENGPRTIKDVKLINAGKILDNSRTVAECQSPLCDIPGGITTMHVVVQAPLEKGNMRSSSEDEKSPVQQWPMDGIKQGKPSNDPRPAAPLQQWLKPGKSSNDPRPAAPVYNQVETDDEYKEAQEETEHNLPKEPTELEDMAEDHDGCDQKTDLDKASHPKIYDTDLKPQRATTGSRHTRDNNGRDGRTEDGPAPKIFVTVNIVPTLGGKRREEHAPADEILVSVPGHTGEGRRDKNSRAGRIVDSGQGPMPPPESPCAGHRGGDRKDEQRQSDRIGSKREKDNGPRTVMEIPEIGRGPAFKHPSPPRNMPGRAAAMPVVAPAPQGKKEEAQSPSPCGCVVV